MEGVISVIDEDIINRSTSVNVDYGVGRYINRENKACHCCEFEETLERQNVNAAECETSHVSNYIPTTSAVLMDLSSDDGSGEFEVSEGEQTHNANAEVGQNYLLDWEDQQWNVSEIEFNPDDGQVEEMVGGSSAGTDYFKTGQVNSDHSHSGNGS